jgi:hypothetical protein
MPETKMLDKKNLKDKDLKGIKDEMEDEGRKIQEKVGSTCSGKDPYVPKNPVKKQK